MTIDVLTGSTVPIPSNAPPATLAAGASYETGIMSAAGFHALEAACTLSQAGSISIQRYIDPAGTIAIGAAITQTISATVAATVAVDDGVDAASWQVTITNTSEVTATLTDTAFLGSV